MKAQFSKLEKQLLEGKKASIAKKHNCSITYVDQITRGLRNINTELSKKIHTDLKKLIEFFTPEATTI